MFRSETTNTSCRDPAGNRTPNRQLRRLMLYPIELPDHTMPAILHSIARFARQAKLAKWTSSAVAHLPTLTIGKRVVKAKPAYAPRRSFGVRS